MRAANRVQQIQARLLALLLVSATLVAYLPAWNGKPVYDDYLHLTAPELRSPAGLARIWTELGVVQQYYPVVHTAFWLEHRLWGGSMPGYHLANISLHAISALLLVRVLKRLEIPGAWLAAGVFALHPVMVESVAWISELKNTLSTVFYLCAALAYLRFDRSKAHKREPDAGRARSPLRAASTAGPDWRAETARPASVVMNTRFEEQSFYILALILFVLGLLSKSVVASLPAALLVVFWWKRGGLSWKLDVRPLIPFFVAALAMGALTVWVEKNFIGAEGKDFQLTAIERCLVAGRAVWFYLGKLFWPAELMMIYPRWNISQSVWWQYLFPSMLLVLLAGLWRLRRRWRGPLAALLFFGGTLFPALGFINVYPFRYSFVADHYVYLAALGPIVLAAASLVTLVRRAKASFCGVLLMTLFFLTWRQSHMYTDSETLWRMTCARNPGCSMAEYNLGNTLLEAGQAEQAIVHFRKALAIEPDDAATHCNLGHVLRRMGRLDEAAAHYQAALNSPSGDELAEVTACNGLGTVLLDQNLVDEAIAHFEKAVELHPGLALTRNNLARALRRKGQAREALAHYRASLELQPDNARTLSDMAWVLATCPEASVRDGAQAVELAQRADELSGGLDPVLLGTLAAAYAEAGRFDEAVTTAQRALKLAHDHPELVLADSLQSQLRLYQAHAQFRETVPAH